MAETIGHDLDQTTDELATLNAQEYIEVWEREEGPVVILSPWFAKELGYHLIEVGSSEEPRWAKLGDPVPSPPRAKYVCVDVRGAEMSMLIDPGLSPDIAAEEAEACGTEAELWTVRQPPTVDLPRPKLLLGSELTPWPGPDHQPLTPCPACAKHPKLAPHVYCLCCDRWGLDHLLPKLKTAPDAPAQTPRGPKRPQVDLQRDSNARVRRKARRQARLVVQTKQEKSKLKSNRQGQ